MMEKRSFSQLPNLVHIGLPKTATTTLQQKIFPEVVKMCPDLEFNSKVILDSLSAISLGLEGSATTAIQNQLRRGGQIISSEHLVNWNPHNWQSAAEKT